MNYKTIVLLLILCSAVIGCAGLGQQKYSDKLGHEEQAEIDRGRYMVEIMGCNDCHTSWITGGAASIPEEDWLLGSDRGLHGSWGTAYPTNLRLLMNSINQDEWLLLAKKMRRDSPMAWVMLPKATDADLRAIYKFVRYLGPKGVPAPENLPPGVKPETNYIELPLPH